jgi:gamma-tubulin complex component 4
MSELEAFSDAIMRVSKMNEFNILLFSKIIEEIRECVASRLWHLIVLKGDLTAHLSAIKEYFLLGKGEFY